MKKIKKKNMNYVYTRLYAYRKESDRFSIKKGVKVFHSLVAVGAVMVDRSSPLYLGYSI